MRWEKYFFSFFSSFFCVCGNHNYKENGKQSVEPEDSCFTVKSRGKHHLKFVLGKLE